MKLPTGNFEDKTNKTIIITKSNDMENFNDQSLNKEQQKMVIGGIGTNQWTQISSIAAPDTVRDWAFVENVRTTNMMVAETPAVQEAVETASSANPIDQLEQALEQYPIANNIYNLFKSWF